MKTGARLAIATVGVLLGAGVISGPVRRRLAGLLSPDEDAHARDLVAFVPNPTGNGGWTLDRRGNIFAFGNAPEFREIPEPVPWRQTPFVAMAGTPSGRGLWTLDARGNIYAFGDAPEFREVPEPVPWRQASFVSMASTPSGRGVWILDRLGNIFAFGDASELQPARPGR
ncbi:MAG TPA: hypothetical protein VEL75_14015 [Candidatus Methylomirabilis sp.]|nr:hypothetical protein [Candidatus Methylomirabilis sp.]